MSLVATLPVSLDKEGLRPVETPDIGRFYWVSLVRFVHRHSGPDILRPIIGPLHDDKVIVNFEEEHWHVDWRFVTPDFYDYVTANRYGTPHAVVLSKKNCLDEGRIFRHRRKCRRMMPEAMPPHIIGWLPALEDAYEAKRMKCLTCPHKGMPLDPQTVDAEGRITCPAHGLRWNVATGALSRRTEVVV